MPAKIVRLPEQLINQIAAGEVVENAASIVKELVENCLDAGACRIDVWIEGGGERLIRVEDDGCGMGDEDAVLSLERHATSKIRTQGDLESLATMGFRGEALAAIAAVSHFEMKTSEGRGGHRVVAEGGKIAGVEPCARNRGTTIEVRSLFFNVPARKKFLKSPGSNTAHVVRVMETVALAHPEAAFSLCSEGKTLVEVAKEPPQKRVEGLLGVMPHEVRADGLWGYLSPASEAKAHRRGQYLFVNRRPIFSPLVSKAVKAGYGVRIDERSHPSFVLFLEIDPGSVDVNVHPQKREVRFADEPKIFRLVERGVASGFEAPSAFGQKLSFPSPSLPFLLGEQDSVPRIFQETHSSPYTFDFAAEEMPLAVVDGYLLLLGASLIIVDLQSAHARVLYESLQHPKGVAQSLLWPLEVTVEGEEIQAQLEAMGIECRWIGKKTLAIDALPPLLEGNDFSQFLQAWQEGKRIEDAASRYARGTKRLFSLEEAHFLWKELQRCKESKFDPKGKRIWESLDGRRLQRIWEGTK